MPLEFWNKFDDEISEKRVPDKYRGQKTRKKFAGFYREQRKDWLGYWPMPVMDLEWIPDLKHAHRIFQCLEKPQEYEIIEVSREPFSDRYHFLGYDVGYWGNNHFSLICDTVVMPMWHPAPPEALGELREKLSGLNKHVLFSTEEKAAAFREYYRSRACQVPFQILAWAETEAYEGEFCIIRVASVK